MENRWKSPVFNGKTHHFTIFYPLKVVDLSTHPFRHPGNHLALRFEIRRRLVGGDFLKSKIRKERAQGGATLGTSRPCAMFWIWKYTHTIYIYIVYIYILYIYIVYIYIYIVYIYIYCIYIYEWHTWNDPRMIHPKMVHFDTAFVGSLGVRNSKCRSVHGTVARTTWDFRVASHRRRSRRCHWRLQSCGPRNACADT